jgi:hypothetical protein
MLKEPEERETLKLGVGGRGEFIIAIALELNPASVHRYSKAHKVDGLRSCAAFAQNLNVSLPTIYTQREATKLQ